MVDSFCKQKQVDYSKELKRLSLKHNKILFSKEKVAAKLSKLQSTGKGHLSVTTKLQEKVSCHKYYDYL